MSGWGSETPVAAATDNQDWNGGGAADGWTDGFTTGMVTNGDGGFNVAAADGFAGGGDAAGASDNACRNCGQNGHFARDCPEPRKGGGGCFNCGQEGHSKAECTEPRKFKGECRNCGQEGHMAGDCPTRVDKCKNCQQEGHVALECKNPKTLDKSNVAEKSEDEAWALLQQASDERDIGDFKEAVQILSKTCPDYTYEKLEKECRSRGFSIYLIAMEKDHGDTWTNVNLQGEIGKKYAVSYFTSDKAQRPALLDKWPASPEENLTRLADAGTPLDRGVEKCNNCNQLGHSTRRCPDEKMASVQPTVTCFLCGEEGHRVRDCGQKRKPAGRACKICEAEDHLAKDCPNKEKRACRVCGNEEHMAADCPNKEKRTCRNCGEEDHISKDCPNPRKVTCNNCSEEGHMSRECPMPRKKVNWAEVTCSQCKKKGHGRARCPDAPSTEANGDGGMNNAAASAPGGGWDAPAASGSAQSEWENMQRNDAFGGGATSAW